MANFRQPNATNTIIVTTLPHYHTTMALHTILRYDDTAVFPCHHSTIIPYYHTTLLTSILELRQGLSGSAGLPVTCKRAGGQSGRAGGQSGRAVAQSGRAGAQFGCAGSQSGRAGALSGHAGAQIGCAGVQSARAGG